MCGKVLDWKASGVDESVGGWRHAFDCVVGKFSLTFVGKLFVSKYCFKHLFNSTQAL